MGEGERATHRYDAFASGDGHQGEVALRTSCRRVYGDVDMLLPLDDRRWHGHDGVDVGGAEALLQRVECESLGMTTPSER